MSSKVKAEVEVMSSKTYDQYEERQGSNQKTYDELAHQSRH